MNAMRPRLFLFVLIGALLAGCAPVLPAPGAVAVETGPTSTARAVTAEAQSALATMVAGTLAPTATIPQPTPSPTFTVMPSATPAPSAVPGQPDPALLEARAQYTIDVEFSYGDRTGKAQQEITYTNRSGDVLPELPLMVELYAYRELFSFTGLWWEDGTPIENAARENIQVRVPLRKPLLPGESITLKMAYEFRLPSQAEVSGERPIPLGYTGRQVNLVDWYPFIPPYRSGSGWLAHPPSYYGEHLVYDLADFAVNLKLIDNRSDLTVAASAQPEIDGDWLRYQHNGARNFALSIGHEYVTESEEVDGVTVTSYYFPLNDAAGKRALQTTVESVELFNELFGPYPHDTLAVVEADFYDGMEYDGLYFLSRAFYNIHKGDPGDYLVAIAAHETAHQWWYGMVGNDQANEPWLDEALSTYSEHIFYEHYYPEALDWWWYYRINYYRPRGWVDTSVYNPEGTLQTYQDYRNAVYLNGAHFFEDLREVIGEEAFFAFLKDYTKQFSGQVAMREDFFALLEQHTEEDLSALKAKYFGNLQ